MSSSTTKKTICGTDLSIDWLRETIQEQTGDSTALSDWSAKKIGVGKGYGADIIRVTFDWANNDNRLPRHVVLKVANLAAIRNLLETVFTDEDRKGAGNAIPDDDSALLNRVIVHESLAYRWLNDHPTVKAPKAFYTAVDNEKGPKVLVLEDLSESGVSIDVTDGLNLEQIVEVAKAVGHLHAVSLNDRESWLPKARELEEEQKAEEEKNKAKREKASENDNPFPKYRRILQEMNPTDYALLSDERVWKVFDVKYLTELSDKVDKMLNDCKVFAHGDLWCNNIFFEKTNPNKLRALIDWTLAPINPLHDLSWTMAICCKPEVRRESAEHILRAYYTSFTETLTETPPFTFAQLQQASRARYAAVMVQSVASSVFAHGSPLISGPNKKEKQAKLTLRCKCLLEDYLEHYAE